jgi:opacity protein-like surface antigen
MRKLLTAFSLVVLAASPALAQDKPVDFNFGFGWVFPVSNLKNDFDAGWTGTLGVTFNVKPNLGFMVDYSYDHMNGPDKVISVSNTPALAVLTNGIIQSNHQMHVLDFDVVYKAMPHDSPVGGYVLGGAGYYHRIVQLTSPSVGYTTICDPYWYVCYPAAVSVDQIIGDRSSNDFGINFGGGVTFGHEAKFYVEARYHYVFGKTITPTTALGNTVCPNSCSTSASYFPLIFGIRW